MNFTKGKEKSSPRNIQPLRTKQEIDELAWSLRRHCSERDFFMFVFGVSTGLRVSDIVDLKVKDVRGQDVVYIKEKKRDKRREVFLDTILDKIEDYTKGMKEDDWLFPSRQGGSHITPNQAYRALVKAGLMIDRDDIGTHTMRKTFGYHHYKANKDILQLMEIFQHSSPSVTKRYIGITSEEHRESIRGLRLFD